MNIRTLLHLVALAAGFTSTSAQFSFKNATQDAFDAVSGALSAVECSDETRANSQCKIAPFSGTYVCRKFGSIFGGAVENTVCSQNVVEGFTLGVKTDRCGCCPGEDGAPKCPVVCTCECGEGKVMVDVQVLSFIKFSRCVTNGWSQHTTAWGNAVKCTEECPDESTDDAV